MSDRLMIVIAALNMAFAVAAGAFGAHGLKSRVDADLVSVWNTAVLYQLVHALAILALALLATRLAAFWVNLSASLMFAGIVLFSGSLYVLVLSGVRLLGAVTPLGGVAFIAAWLVLAWAALRGQ